MTKHTVKTIASGEYSCSCGAVWDRDEGDECPNSETPAQLGTRLHAEMREAVENSAKMRQPLEEIAERAAFEAWYETTYGISLEPEFRANHFIGYVNDKANHRWTAWQARAALSANHSEQAREVGHDGWRQAVDNVSAYAHLYNSGFGIIHEIRAEYARLLAAAPSAGSASDT